MIEDVHVVDAHAGKALVEAREEILCENRDLHKGRGDTSDPALGGEHELIVVLAEV